MCCPDRVVGCSDSIILRVLHKLLCTQEITSANDPMAKDRSLCRPQEADKFRTIRPKNWKFYGVRFQFSRCILRCRTSGAGSASLSLEEYRRRKLNSVPPVHLHLGHEQRVSGSGGSHAHLHPVNLVEQARIPLAGPAEVAEAVERAQAAQEGWRRTSPEARRDILNRL